MRLLHYLWHLPKCGRRVKIGGFGKADDFALVTGSGKTYTKPDLLDEARSGRFAYEHQEDTAQTVRVLGQTATITAKLWAKGADNGKPFDYTVWFTDTYVRTRRASATCLGSLHSPCPKTAECSLRS